MCLWDKLLNNGSLEDEVLEKDLEEEEEDSFLESFHFSSINGGKSNGGLVLISQNYTSKNK